MQILQKLGIISLSIFFILSGCQNSSAPEEETNPQEETQIQEETVETPTPETPEDKITGILLAYYHGLEDSKLDESKFFANELQQFFGSTNISREKVAQSIRGGFNNFENREIILDGTSLKVTETNWGYIAEFSGTSNFVKKGESENQSQKFSNRVSFNTDFQIIRYESQDAPMPSTARKIEMRSPPRIEAATRILNAFQSGKLDDLKPYIHPEMGYYLILRPGAMDVTYQCTDPQSMVKYAYWIEDGIKNIKTKPTLEELPNFNCGDYFSKEGTFMAEVSDFDAVSHLMGYLNKADLGNYDEESINAAHSVENYVSNKIVDTASEVAIFLGQIDGKWYLLCLDLATYDCSA